MKSYKTKKGVVIKELNSVQVFERVENAMYTADKETLRPFVEFAYANYPSFMKFIDDKISND